MIRNHSNELGNSLIKMSNTNRASAEMETLKLSSYSSRTTSYRRNGSLNFGAQQLMDLNINLESFIWGSSSGSGTVGP